MEDSLRHVISGIVFLLFGCSFLFLTAYRLNRIATALAFLERTTESSSPRSANDSSMVEHEDGTDDDDIEYSNEVEDPSEYVTLWARTYCRQHIPEYDIVVVYRASVAIVLCSVCSLIFESLNV